MMYIGGLDWGQMSDPAALAIAGVKDKNFCVRHLQRWQLGTSPTKVIDDLARLYRRPPLSGSTLVCDAGGPGWPVVQGLREQTQDVRIVPVVSHSGHTTGRTKGRLSVPKVDLVASLRMVLGQYRIRISSKLPLAKTVQRELENFQLRMSDKGNETFGNADTSTHDDLVIALALLTWYGSRCKIQTPLRTIRINTQKAMDRFIWVVGIKDVHDLDLDEYLPTLVVSFIDPAPTPTINGLLGKHVISCLDTEPAEITGPWSEDQQSGMFSPQQAKALWSFLKQPDTCKWRCLVVVDNGDGDRRALSLARAIADCYSLPHTAVMVHGQEVDEDVYTEEEEPAPNQHIFHTAKLGRYSVL